MRKPLNDLSFGKACYVSRRGAWRLILLSNLAIAALTVILPWPARAQPLCPEVLCPKAPAKCEAASSKTCLDDKTILVCSYTGTQACTNPAVSACASVEYTEACTGSKACSNGKCVCTKKATFTPSAVRTGPPAQMDITVHDPVNGVGQIIATKLVNATLDIPSFVPGTTAPIVTTATKIDPSLSTQVELRACTVDGCCQNGDPVLAVLQVARKQKRVRQTFANLPLADQFVRIQNGAPGLYRIDVLVNGLRVKTFRLGRSEVAMTDIGPYLAKTRNLITIVGFGRPGHSAIVLISDEPSAQEGSSASAVPFVIWKQGPVNAGENLRWGGEN